MEFIETPTFTRLVLALMDDDDYARLQASLALQPVLGKVIPGRRRHSQGALGRPQSRETGWIAGHLLLAGGR